MIINGKKYEMPELSFNAVCKLEDIGMELTKVKGVLNLIRGMVALAMDSTLETAGRELDEHLSKGGDIDEITSETLHILEKSGFFQLKRSMKKTPTVKKTEQLNH